MAEVTSSYYRQNTFDESPALSCSYSTSISDIKKEFTREGSSCSSFEDPSLIIKKKPILKKPTSFQKRKRCGKSGKKIGFKKEIAEVFNVESFKEFNVDMSDYYDFMGIQCQKTSCTLF